MGYVKMKKENENHTTVRIDRQTSDTLKLIAKRTNKKQAQVINELFDKLLWLVSSMNLTKPFELEYEFERTRNELIVSVHGVPNLVCESIQINEKPTKPLIVDLRPQKPKPLRNHLKPCEICGKNHSGCD